MRRFLLFPLLGLCVASLSGQTTWRYVREIKIPASDTGFVTPYLCTVTSAGRLYVLSSALTNAAAHNAIYYCDSNSTTLTRMIDYFANGDQDSMTGNIGQLRGISSVGTDVMINASVPYPRSRPNTVSTIYYYPAGDTARVQKYGFYLTGAGYGTHNHGTALTKDTIAFLGVTAGATGPGPFPRFYNMKYAPLPSPPGTARGSWINAAYQIEPGGVHNAGVDIIRDCAVNPFADYGDTNVAWYTSRNSVSSTQITGGIAKWVGGTQILNPAGYRGTRVLDAFGLLSFSNAVSYGITVGRNGWLWVAGIDSTRRWVKAFDVSAGVFANEIVELPAQFSVTYPDPAGAPLLLPVDVALSPSGQLAYVSDAQKRAVYLFTSRPNDVKGTTALPVDFRLEQNFPNPFNPTTTISFTLPKTTRVRLSVTNLLGQEVAMIADGVMEAGKHVRSFTGENLASGMYYYTLAADGVRLTKKMLLVK